MTKPRMVFCAIISALVMGVANAANAEWHPLTSENPTDIKVEVIEAQSDSTLLKLSLPGFNNESMQVNDKTYSKISIPGSQNTSKRGWPSLPRKSESVLIPKSSIPKLTIVNQNSVVMDLGTPVPSKGSLTRDLQPDEVDYTFSSLYSEDTVYPKRPVELGKPFTLRDTTGVSIQYLPFSYDSSTGLTTVTTELMVRIDANGPKQSTTEKSVPSAFIGLYRSHFANYDTLSSQKSDSPRFVPETGRLLIITHKNFLNALAPFVKWKTQKGMWVKTVTLSMTGKSAVEIKEYIKDQYNRNNIAYVIIIGDAEYIPYPNGFNGNATSGEADPVYSLVDGDDSYPDLFVSRISVTTSFELTNVVSKIVNYEKHPDRNGEWYSKATGIASNESGAGTVSDIDRMKRLKSSLETFGYTHFDEIYQPDADVQQVTDALNDGRGFVNYIGHGLKNKWVTSDFESSDIDALENSGKLPFIVSVACLNGDFGSGADSFAEKWIKAGTVNNPTGAVAIYASSTLQSWIEPTIAQSEIVRLLTTERANTIGGLFFNGSIAMLKDDTTASKQTFETWNIFGDASMFIRTKAPEPISTNFKQRLVGNKLTFSLDVGEKGISAGLLVGNQLVGSSISSDNGIIELTIENKPQSPILLTLTGFNKIPVVMEL